MQLIRWGQFEKCMTHKLYILLLTLFFNFGFVAGQELIYNSETAVLSSGFRDTSCIVNYDTLSEVPVDLREALENQLKIRTKEHFQNIKFRYALSVDIETLLKKHPDVIYEIGQIPKLSALYEWQDLSLGIGLHYILIAIDSYGQLIRLNFPNLNLHKDFEGKYESAQFMTLDKAKTKAEEYISDKISDFKLLSYSLIFDDVKQNLYWSFDFLPSNDNKEISTYYTCNVDALNWRCEGFYQGEIILNPSILLEIEEEIIEFKKEKTGPNKPQ